MTPKEFPNLGTLCRPAHLNGRDNMIHGLAWRMLINELTPASVIIARMIPNPPTWAAIIADGDAPLATKREVALEFYFADLLTTEE